MSCIDYSKLTSITSGPTSVGHLDDVLIGQCLTRCVPYTSTSNLTALINTPKYRTSFSHIFFIFSITGFYIFQLITFALSLPRLLEMYRFYTYLLGVPDVGATLNVSKDCADIGI